MALPYVGVSASANNSTIYVTGHFYNNGSTWQGAPGCRFTLSIDGIGNIYDQRHTFSGNSFDFSASRGVGTSYNNRTYTVHAWWDSSGFSHGTDYATTTVTVPAVARPTYTVSYNANGGTGAPASQTHLINTVSKISGVTPTRANYVFLGWSTSSTATKPTYIINGQYTNNSFTNGATVTLYAVWAKKHPIYFNSSEHSFKSVWVNVPSGKSLKSVWFKTG